jgi:hypothetical protein
MSAATFNLVIEQNSTFNLSVALNDGAQPTPAPINIDGCTILSQIRHSSLEPVLATFFVNITNAVGGIFNLYLNNSQTLALPITTASDKLRYDVLLIRPNNTTERLFEGNVSVIEAISI